MRPDSLRLLGLILLVVGCGGAPEPATDPQSSPPEITLSSTPDRDALHLVGELKGPALGLGPEIAVEAWIRADRWLRADLRFEDEKGAQAHEVLVWGPDTCLLFDRRKGRYTALGDAPGELELDQGVFLVQHALWLALGRWIGEEPLAGRWEKGEWWGRDGQLGLRTALQGEDPRWLELVWRGERLRSDPQDWQESAWGPVPRRLELSGSFLESVVKAQWRVESIPAFGDETLDPLLDP